MSEDAAARTTTTSASVGVPEVAALAIPPPGLAAAFANLDADDAAEREGADAFVDATDAGAAEAAPAAAPSAVCASCVGLVAYVFCEACEDAFCARCFDAVHKGRLALHAHYVIAHPPGAPPPNSVVGYVELPPDEAAHSSLSAGMQLMREFSRSMRRAQFDAAPPPAVVQARSAAVQALRMQLRERGDVADLKIADVGRYIRRQTRLGSLAPSLQMHIRLPPIDAVRDAAESLVTDDAVKAVGGWDALKRRPLDPWVGSAVVKGAGIEAYPF
jgi:hypothetical protein